MHPVIMSRGIPCLAISDFKCSGRPVTPGTAVIGGWGWLGVDLLWGSRCLNRPRSQWDDNSSALIGPVEGAGHITGKGRRPYHLILITI